MNDYGYSVIIPNFNKSQYLEKCIRSVENQTLVADEIIVVDDCSTDNSIQVLLELQKKHKNLRILSLKKNGGVSNARNEGARICSSSYLKFLDADDFFFSNDNCALEMELIKKYKKRGEDVLAYSAVVFADNDGEITNKPNCKRKIRYVQGRALYDILARLRFSSIANNFMVSKEVFIKSGGFNYPYNFYEDYEILIRLAKEVRFFFSGTYGRAYRWTPDGLSKQSPINHKNALDQIFNMYYSKLNAWGRINVLVRIFFREFKQSIMRH